MAQPSRRMARCLVPLPDESLPGFALRLGHRLLLPPGHVIWRLGLIGTNPTTSLATASHLVVLDPVKRERLARNIGTTARTVDELTMRPLGDRFPHWSTH